MAQMENTSCLCSISTRQLELLLQRAQPDSQTYLEDCTIFFIQLNYINELQLRCCHLMLTPFATRLQQGIPLPLIQLSHKRQTLRGSCWVVTPCSPEQQFQLSSANTT